MARAIWSGSISFGLVNVPVKAYSAVRDHDVHFHQVQKKSGARIRYKKVSEKSGREIDKDDIELGYELSPGHYVTVDPDELDELRPRTTRTIEMLDFVPLEDIDPIYYDHTYWLAPADDTAKRPYELLIKAMEDEGRIGIGSVVMRRKQYLAAIRPVSGALAMSTMRFADEVIDRSDIEQIPPRKAKPSPKEVKLASSIIDALANDWDPTRYHDTYTEELRKIIKRRSEGKEVKIQEAPAAAAEVVDLMEALEASVAAAKKARNGDVNKEIAKAAKKLAKEAEHAEAAGDDDGKGSPKRSTKARKRTARKASTSRATRTRKAAKRSGTKAKAAGKRKRA